MKLRFAVPLAAVGLAVGMLAGAAIAKPKPKAKGVESGKVDKQLQIAPEGLRWGLSLEAISKTYDSYFDEIYLKQYRKTQPGPDLEALDAEVSDKKKLIKRNVIVFGNTPTGVDQSGLRGEYTYGNGESLTRLILSSKFTRNFFFFNNKLWKIYDEYDVTGGGPLGASFEEAVNAVSELMGGVKPQRLEADFAAGRSFPEARWKTTTMQIRLVGRDPIVGVVYSDLSVESDLPSRRKNKPRDPNAIDSSVRDVTKGR